MKQETIIPNEEKVKEAKVEPEQKSEIKNIRKRENAFVITLIFIGIALILSIYWLYNNTGNVTLEQLLFHLQVPIKGTNSGMLWEYFYWTFSKTLIITLIIGIIIGIIENKEKINQEKLKKQLYFLSKTVLLSSIITSSLVMNVFGFAKNQITASKLIEEEYIDPLQANTIFPEEKQNLIYIYLESMESTFTSKENGGIYEECRIPELAEIAQKNINFSNTNKLGGALNLKGSHWTIAAMVSQTSGIPLKISIGENDYGKHSSFLPGAYTLGEILEENGYKNYLLLGSESEFGGRKEYFENHGNYKIWDYKSAIQENRMKEEEKVWWGYADQDLFEYAKEQLTEISKKNEPFNYTMLTVDTHFTDGYICEQCENHFEDQYSNVMKCSSGQVAKFIEWIKQQDFFENTTVIITGDHVTMQASIQELVDEKEYGERTVFNAFINSKVDTQNTTNRLFFTIDMFPTTIAALGARIEGERLGLGTNLFSNEQTLAEKYGVEYLRKELEKKSAFYNKKILYNE